MSQRGLSQASGVAVTRISDYERGRHQPSAAMLIRLVEATGHRLALGPNGRPDPAVNARLFADVLSLADAIPSDGRRSPEPPTWAALMAAGQETSSQP